MPTKYGRVVRFGRRGRTFTEVYLEDGQKVELSDLAMENLMTYRPEDAIVFVERRGILFNYVQWLGTPEEALAAEEDGTLRRNDIPAGVRLIAETMRRIENGTSTLRLTSFDEYDLYGSTVAEFLVYLRNATAREWLLMTRCHSSIPPERRSELLRDVEVVGSRAVAAGYIRPSDVDDVKARAEAAAIAASADVLHDARERLNSSSAVETVLPAAMRATANAMSTLVLISPAMTEGESARFWDPYKTLGERPW